MLAVGEREGEPLTFRENLGDERGWRCVMRKNVASRNSPALRVKTLG
jgi:hypothetical protein